MVGAGTPGREGTPMLTVVPDVAGALPADGQPSSLIDQIVRDGARQMLAAALQAEVAAYIDQFAGVCDENGRRLVVRNGAAEPRTVLTSAGAVEVTAPRVNDKRTDPATGERNRFSSAILPPWARKTPQISEVLPPLYLHGLSSGDFVPALGQFLGSHAGLSSSTVTRLTETWSAEAAAFMTRDLSGADYVYLWVDGIHLGSRLGEGKLFVLVMIGVRADGRKELIALADGYRESAGSWADLLRDCARRGMRAPVLAAGDGALGFWGALREVFPQTTEQRCWFHSGRKESTCRRVVRCSGGEELGGCAVAGWRRPGNAVFLLEQGQGFADDVADGGSADIAEGVGQDIQRAQSSVGEQGEQDAFAIADLLVEDTTAGAGLARAATPLAGEAFGLGGLPRSQACGEVMQLAPGEPGQRRVGQPLDDCGPCGAPIAVREGEQGIVGGEPDRGHSRVAAVVFEDLAGLLDQVADAGGGDFQQVGEHVHGADLPLVEEGEQQPGRVVEQRPGAYVPVGSPGPAAALLAVPLLSPRGLGGGEGSGQLLRLGGGHAGQPRGGQLCQRGLAALGRAAGFAGRRLVCGAGNAPGGEGVVPGAVRGGPFQRQARHPLLADRDAGRVVAAVQHGLHPQPAAGPGRCDGLDDHLMAGQRPAPPVEGGGGEQPVLDLG